MAMRRVASAGARSCPDTADHSERDRSRAARRLRRLARALSVLAQAERSPTSARNCNAMAKFAAAPAAAGAAALQSAWKRTAAPQLAGRDVRLCLAARALSGMLCDEPNAARCRTVVRSRRSPTVGAAAR